MNRTELLQMAERETEKRRQAACHLHCCASTACLSSGSLSVRAALQAAITAAGAEDRCQVVPVGCMGLCGNGPMVHAHDENGGLAIYEHVTPATASDIVARHVGGATGGQARELPTSLPFFRRQRRVVLSNSGLIDPERIEDAVAAGAYQSLARALVEMTPAEVCEIVTRSGLRGRGGAGYPTGVKWGHVRTATGARKHVIANGDEGDPGAYMDRTLMEADPHRILEGMALAAYAVGAEQGYIYVRGEYPIAVKRLERAIRQANRAGLLGKDMLGSGIPFTVDVRIGAGAFVCGEETALIASVEGRRGTPRIRPPFPAQSGLWGQPTLLSNVETFGNIAPIVEQGADWFAGIGSEKSKGTKVFALTGKLRHTGLIEVPMGITLREIVEEIGGGIPDGRPFKAAQTGSPSGGCIPAEHLDTPVDYDSLRDLGSIMGSGGLIVMDDQSCMPDVARFFMEFCADESCGKCVPCRVGTVEMLGLLDRITTGAASLADLRQLEDLCATVSRASLCGLGQSAPNPVLSTLRYFRDEYEAHIVEGRCPAGVCDMAGRGARAGAGAR